MLFIDKKSISL